MAVTALALATKIARELKVPAATVSDFIRPINQSIAIKAANDNFKRLGMAKGRAMVLGAIATQNSRLDAIKNDFSYNRYLEKDIRRPLEVDGQPMRSYLETPAWLPNPGQIPDYDPEPIDPSVYDPDEWRRMPESKRRRLAEQYGLWVERQMWRENLARERERVARRDRVAICIKRVARRRALGALGYYQSRLNYRKHKPVHRNSTSKIWC